ADAYGHGAVAVTRALLQSGVSDFAVATLEEALALRQAGINSRLLVLGGCFAGQEDAFLRHSLMPAVLDLAAAVRLSAAAVRRRQQVRAHLKVDTGMGRVGFTPAALQEALPRLAGLPGLVIHGFMSHLACADEADAPVTGEQQRLFAEILGQLRSFGIHPAEVHLCNSAGVAGQVAPECTLARPGIMLYGGLPGPGFASRLDLKPVMHLRSCIAQIRHLPAGSGISYGHSYRASRPLTLAVLPIGYADGYNRLLSNRGEGIVRGVKVPVVGRVCMDWIMLDVSAVADIAVGDCVTLLGSAAGLTLLADDLADQIGTISYEVFCRIGPRVPRRYLPAL
ncbi:MAG: alanine racemase, partial [Pelovirga sp.]